MNSRLQVQLNMVGACITVYKSSDYKPVWNANEPADFGTDIVQLATDYGAVTAKAAQADATTGGTTSQKAAAVHSHHDGYGLCVAALSGLANDARHAEWFGTHTAARFNTVKANYGAVKKRMETVQFIYNFTGAGCKPGVFAYTCKGTSTIWFCNAYWSASAMGIDSKAGTVLHEHTHSDFELDFRHENWNETIKSKRRRASRLETRPRGGSG